MHRLKFGFLGYQPKNYKPMTLIGKTILKKQELNDGDKNSAE